MDVKYSFSLNIVMQTMVNGMATDSLPENKENLCGNRKQTDNNMETKDGFIIRLIKKMDNAQMARLIRCVIDGFGVLRTGTVYDDPATDCISQSVENANENIG